MLRPGQVVALCVLALLTIGIVMVPSAGMTVEAKTPVTLLGVLLSKSVVYMGLALLAMFVTSRLWVLKLAPGVANTVPPPAPASGWTLWPMWVAAIAFVAAMGLVYVPGVGRTVNGSHRWLVIAGQSLQPSEIAKWGLVAVMAWYGWRMRERLGSFLWGLMPALACAGAVAGFVVLEDLGTGVLIGIVAAIVLLSAGARLWQFALMVPVGALGFVAAVVANPYRLERLRSFVDPYGDPQGRGYHMIQSMVAISNGQVWGRGLGHGLQKFGYLPEDTTDFIFSIICEELGVPGAAVIIALYIGMLWASYLIIRKQTIPIFKLVGVGIIATVGVQALVNLCVVTGWGPTKGIALPLLSSRGTGWILTAASLGLLIGMDRFADAEQAAMNPLEMELDLDTDAPVTQPAAAAA